jgi:hypothetical protein
MRRSIAPLVAVLCLSTSAVAAPMLGGPTPCSGSWDGPGLTACELFGAPGVVGAPSDIDWTLYTIADTPLAEITALADGNSLRVDQLGQLVYQRAPAHAAFASLLHRRQFALWPLGAHRYAVGIEDLTDDDSTGSDWDYQDYIVSAILIGEPTTYGVPEPAMASLWLFAAAGLIRRFYRR